MSSSVARHTHIDLTTVGLLLVTGLVVLRVAGLIASPIELHGDEAQYWTWSRELAWGYYSKPPLIAWVIAATTGLFGDVEWAIRIAAPLSHGAAALFVTALGRDLGGPRVGFWAGLAYATMPGVWLSSAVISTDAFLLPLASAALFFLNRFVDKGRWTDAIALGLAVGLGFLAKYAMIYFAVGVFLSAIWIASARRAYLTPQGFLAAAVAIGLITPNLMWNAANDFATVVHTADNANWIGDLFNPLAALEFFGGQLGVFGPVSFALLLIALFRRNQIAKAQRDKARLLITFVAPVLVVVTFQAFISRAHANWAAFAYAGGSTLVALWAVHAQRERILAIGLAVHVAFGALFATAGVSPGFADQVGMANAYKRARGWEETTQQVRAAFGAGHRGQPYAVIAADNRLLFHGMEYYGRGAPLPLAMWLRYDGPLSHAEERAPLTAPIDGPTLIVSERPHERDKIAADFDEIEHIGDISIALGGGLTRELALYAARGFSPLTRDDAYEDRWLEEAG